MKVWICSARVPTAWVLFRWGYRKSSGNRISEWNFICVIYLLQHISLMIITLTRSPCHRCWSVPSLLPICRMLDEMETDLDKTTQRLDFVTQKTKEMIKRSGGKQNFLIIVALIVVAFILILLILYT